MIKTTYEHERGETVLIPVADDGAVPGGASLITAHARRIRGCPGEVEPDEPIAAAFSVNYRAADSNFPVGWTLLMDAATCRGLTAGQYLLDLRISDGGGGNTITGAAILHIKEPATP